VVQVLTFYIDRTVSVCYDSDEPLFWVHNKVSH
jgi:hypothetical protein